MRFALTTGGGQMHGSNSATLRESFQQGRTYTLTKEIPSMQVLPSANGGMRLSPVSKLPRGAEIVACGPGFDTETLKVLYQGASYYVFISDLEEKRSAMAAAG
jgi:hypothetical protein